MSASINVKKTIRFIDPGLYLTFGAASLVLLALIVSASFKKVLSIKNVAVKPRQVKKLEMSKIKPELFGVLHIDAKAIIPDNRWVSYQIQLLDQQGKPVASAIKKAWHESGTASPIDSEAALNVRTKTNEEMTVALTVFGYGNKSGGTVKQAVHLEVKAFSGVIDIYHLWGGLVATSALAALNVIAIPLTGKKIISKTIDDSDPSDRATLGGANKLVQVKIDVESDETSPKQMQARLVIKNSYGEPLCIKILPLNLKFHKDDEGEIDRVTGKCQKFFILESEDSYGFHVEITPDAPVDKTTLSVYDNKHTRLPVEVVHIACNEAAA